MTLGEKITLLRKQNGWSQEELADRLDISRQSVSKWESNASVPDLDKIIKLSVLFSVSTDYLLKDNVEMNLTSIRNGEADSIYDDEEPVRNVTLEEATDYMDLVKDTAAKIALGVSICILSPICMLVMGGMAEYGVIAMSEDMAGSIGLVIMFLILIIGVPILIINGMKVGKYEYMETTRLSLEYGIREQVKSRKEAFAATYQKSIAIGVALIFMGIILLAIPSIVFKQKELVEIYEVYAVGGLLAFIACGVFFFVKSGCIQGSFEKLLQEGDYTIEQKEKSKKIGAFSGAYWCIITAIYLWLSFTDGWHSSWVIWPVAGVLFGGIMFIINAVSIRKRH